MSPGLGVVAVALVVGAIVVSAVMVVQALADMIGDARRRKRLEQKDRPRYR